MQAIRLHPAPPDSTSYSPSNPAPSSAFHLDHDVPIPSSSAPGQLLIRVKATTAVRDMLTWPETYAHEYAIPGNDVAGIVEAVFSETSALLPASPSKFKPGDEVFGMASTYRASTWAEYAIVKEEEVELKPRTLSFEEAAALPLSALTAYEALFEHAGIARASVEEVRARSRAGARKEERGRRVLITGAAGAVGVYLVQLAAAAGVHVVAASSSNERNGEFLRGLGADEVVEYATLDAYPGLFDVVIDVVGGEVLAKCWGYVAETGVLISVDSGSFNFVEEHEKRGLRNIGVRALFFIVKGSAEALRYIAELVGVGAVRPFVASVYPLARAGEAYDLANGRGYGRGKVVLSV